MPIIENIFEFSGTFITEITCGVLKIILANDDINNGSEILAAELATNIDRFDFAIQIAKIASYQKRFINSYLGKIYK